MQTIELYAGGFKKAAHVSIYIRLEDAKQRPLTATIEFAVMNGGQRLNVKKSSEHVFDEDDIIWGFPEFCLRADLLNADKKLAVADDVTFEFKLMGSVSSGLQRSPQLEQSLTSLLNGGLHSDVTLVCEGEEIPAHKAILAVRSPVFKAMFACEPNEQSARWQVMIDDMLLAVLRDLLKCCFAFECAGSLTPHFAPSSRSIPGKHWW